MNFEERLAAGSATGTRVLVLGFGIEGQSAARFLKMRGCAVTISDIKPESDFELSVVDRFRQEGFTLEFDTPTPSGTFDTVIRSPGVVPTIPLLSSCRSAGIPISSPTRIFFALCPGVVVGVTGTKGKGTTATLISEMLKVAGNPVVLCGNIGTPMLDILPSIKRDTTVVAELSSFQLLDLDRSPHVAVVLMTTEDHMDFHPTVEDYIEAKSHIMRFQSASDIAIYNADYPSSGRIGGEGSGKKFEISTRNMVREGCFLRGDDIVFTREGSEEVAAKISDVRLPGRHNLENVCAAVAAAKLLGVENGAIRTGLRSFKGLEHRLQLVREMDGVKYYNDSFATNPSSTIAAINAFDAPEVLILGGSPKGSDFTELARAVKTHGKIRAIVGIGDEWPRIKKALEEIGALEDISIIENLMKMPEIVRATRDVARSGDVVLLSPACASFGLFKSYKERGKQFEEVVWELLSYAP